MSYGFGMTSTLRRSALSVVLLLGGLFLVPPGPASAQAPPTPEAVTEAGTANWTQVSAGHVHTCGIRTTGRLYCWGDDSFGRLGNGGAEVDATTPVQVFGNATNWIAVSAGWSHTCALRSTRRLYCWGENGFGELGINSADTHRVIPTPVGAATDWAQVSSGQFHTCARKTNGRLSCWGRDLVGEVGNGGPNDNAILFPQEVSGAFTDWTSVSAGRNHTCGRRAINSGTLFCWGLNVNGQLGNDGVGTTQGVPNQVVTGPGAWTAVSAGEFHTCGRRNTGRLFCWGSDNQGQLGNGSAAADDKDTPVEVAGNITIWTNGFSADGFNTCGRRSNGRLFCWGDDTLGSVGDGGTAGTDQWMSPRQVFGNRTDWSTVNVGQSHSCATRTNRRLYCWGWDATGQLGNGGTNTDRLAPVEVAA